MKSMKLISIILWGCIILLAILIIFRLLQRAPLPNSVDNIKEALMEKTLPALKSTSKDIFPEQRQQEQSNDQGEKF